MYIHTEDMADSTRNVAAADAAGDDAFNHFSASSSSPAAAAPYSASNQERTETGLAVGTKLVEGPRSPDELIVILQRVLGESSPVLVTAALEAEERANNLRLREEQHAACTALEADRARERLRKEEEERLQREAADAERRRKEEEEARERAAREAAEKEAALAKLRKEKAQSLGAESEKGPDVTREIVVKRMEEIVVQNASCSSKPSSSPLVRKFSSQKDQALNCPRCNSTNTKFCYYNNFSLTQPRYFCKTCERYWTAGRSLRNIPVGGGSRKNKRSSSSSASSKKVSDLVLPPTINSQASQNPKIHVGQDLNLGFPPMHHDHFKTFTELIQGPNFDNANIKENNVPASSSSTSTQLSALELLTGMTSRGWNSFMPMPPLANPNTVYSSGFSLPELKPSLNFSLDGLGNSEFGCLSKI